MIIITIISKIIKCSEKNLSMKKYTLRTFDISCRVDPLFNSLDMWVMRKSSVESLSFFWQAKIVFIEELQANTFMTIIDYFNYQKFGNYQKGGK